MTHNVCDRFLGQVHPLASGEIEGALALSLGLHAARCVDCEARLTSARRVVALLEASACEPVEPPTCLVTNIMTALPPDPRLVRRRRHAWGIGVAAAGLGAVAGLTLALVLASTGGLAVGAPFAGLRSLLDALAVSLQQFSGLLTALAGKLPGLSPGTSPAGPGGAFLPGLLLVGIGLIGALSATSVTAARGLAHLRRS